MLPQQMKTPEHAGSPKTAGCSLLTTAIMRCGAWLGSLRRSLSLQRGFSLLESIAAIGVIGIAVVGSVNLLNSTVQTSHDTQGDLGLIQLLRAQVETIENVPYNDDVSKYPQILNIPDNVFLSIESFDPGITYVSNGVALGQVIQQIEVTAKKDEEKASMIFYKIKKR
ncbi:MAG: prepilin-type N-terminal cleavage/methylation domain-containing protein [SAR202 cluster bacterium]|nr:prepilin-type N-terminal cleavage/methylation domain-containing protein [SAR202 cluster bacterium]